MRSSLFLLVSSLLMACEGKDVDRLDGEIDSASGRLDALESGQTAQSEELVTLEARADALEEEVTAIAGLDLTQLLAEFDALKGRVDTIEGAYAEDADVAALGAEVGANTSAIATNTDAIAANTSAISANTDAISANTSKIADHDTAIGANTTAIAANTSAIELNTSGIATNASAISANSSAISTNNSAIATNGTAISDLQKALADALATAEDAMAAADDLDVRVGDLEVYQTVHWKVVPGADGNDNSLLSQKQFSFTKQLDASLLYVSYLDNLRTNGGGASCSWEILFNDQPCNDPGPIESAIYVSSQNSHKVHEVAGFCRGTSAGKIKAGTVKVQVRVKPSPGYGGSDCYTGWNAPNPYLMAQEIAP